MEIRQIKKNLLNSNYTDEYITQTLVELLILHKSNKNYLQKIIFIECLIAFVICHYSEPARFEGLSYLKKIVDKHLFNMDVQQLRDLKLTLDYLNNKFKNSDSAIKSITTIRGIIKRRIDNLTNVISTTQQNHLIHHDNRVIKK